MKGYIYVLMFPDGKWYIGSTTYKYFSSRLASHKTDLNRGVQSNLYNHIRQVGWDCMTSDILETYDIDTKDDLHRYEQDYIELHKNEDCLNERLAFTGLSKKDYDKKYKEMNKERLDEYHQAYRQAHREKHKEYMKAYHLSK